MYIKCVKMQGFKSFADKFELDFNPGISAVVGPNGSGKSNIIDAILWVLGEQSVKSLRADGNMTDVIFSGSKTRDEQKKASVAICFDNSDHKLNTDLTEVEIKRVIYKTGENDYYLNNIKVRLKDITDLLIDVTGKFNIITQGNINALVENKSSERRVLFESAAGVLKYKKRKEDSLKKLDSTKENLTRINLIIKELLTTLKPLEKQKDDAEKYLKIKEELENIEIALIASDITTISNKYDKLKANNENMQKELDLISLSGNDTLEKLKLENLKLEEQINEHTNNIISLTKEIASLTTQKELAIERSKYNLDKKALNNDILSLNEDKLNYSKKIDILANEIESLKKDITVYTKNLNDLSDDEIKTKVKISNLNNEINKNNLDIIELENKIKLEKINIENNAFLPKSISAVINNPRLKGICNTISALIEINEAHTLAINTSLGASANFIVTENMNCAKKAITYLKEERLGRATFLPLDIIKSRHISKDTEYTLSVLPGYIGIASDLISYDSKYQNIMENQLGNVIVVDNLDNLSDIAKICEYKYKIVSLEGDIIYPGGSISGGNTQSKTLFDKNNLNKFNKELTQKKALKENLNLTYQKEDSKYNIILDNIKKLNQKITENRIILESKNKDYEENNLNLNKVINSLKGLNASKEDKLSEEIDNILNNLSNKEKEKEISENSLKQLQSKKFDLSNEIIEQEKIYQKQNNEYHRLENSIKNNDIELGKLEVKLDNLLNNLANDYNLTYEFANNNYQLDLDIDVARNRVSELKGRLKNLNNINIGSIDEYQRLKKRFDFLEKQKDELEVSSTKLLEIISEMDQIMIDKFKTTFDGIAKEFTRIFRVMFKGGNGLLKLTDANDLLNTGINIMAVPPGKKLNSTAALSGGEKALTAICLLFAILSVKPVPYIILDEVEAALDEENVNMFGEYLNSIKNQSQFILVTHKKKMMEYADILYGVTMQESGVSKLVSVKLEDR